MRHATLEDFEEIKGLFKKHKDIFPHVRFDRLWNKINKGQVIYEDGVLITYVIYKRKGYMGDFTILKGECVLNQIISTSGKGSEILKKFFDYVQTNVFLSVRDDNDKAIKFYEKNGMEEIGKISWANGKINGVIFKKNY